ncbi:hypothetical protein AVEN_210595-1 [Araneus ventricosus]|uniref:Uncharacterized protein n=1 Tax=Araneus ventricosus TaxID=182803 RepID=A0A4Y2RHF8_ARAVE|nr:hypothetical protein AVEN_210595-1 [Araneus ventricosus]
MLRAPVLGAPRSQKNNVLVPFKKKYDEDNNNTLFCMPFTLAKPQMTTGVKRIILFPGRHIPSVTTRHGDKTLMRSCHFFTSNTMREGKCHTQGAIYTSYATDDDKRERKISYSDPGATYPRYATDAIIERFDA